MKLPRRRFLHLALGAAALPITSDFAWAQAYPTRPITIVVPFAVGGGTDVIARIVAERMKSSLGQPVIVENVTGAYGTIAVGRVARAAPDGYTLSLGNNSSHVVAGAIYALHYDLLNDFEPVALLSTSPFVLVARKTMPANDLRGLIAWLKANPDKATQGYLGAGGPRAYRRPVPPKRDRHALPVRALSRRRGSDHSGLGGWSDRLGVLRSGRRAAPGACRHDQGLWSHRQDPAGLRA